MIDIKIKRLHPDAQLPTRATSGSSGYDVYALNDIFLKPGQSTIAELGFSVEIPEGYEIQVRSRSGLAAKQQIFVTNSPGTIDSDYRGEVKVLLTRLGTLNGPAFIISKGERVAQLVLAEVPKSQIIEVTEVSGTERGSGGFGSTGA